VWPYLAVCRRIPEAQLLDELGNKDIVLAVLDRVQSALCGPHDVRLKKMSSQRRICKGAKA
jgi:hypothetical protein